MPQYYTISQINGYLESKMTADPFLKTIWLKGEISNFKAHGSGHYYFSLQDKTSSLRCVMFHFYASALSFLPYNGLEVFAKGKVTVYSRDGNCQLVATEIIAAGTGDQQLALLELKEKLQEEGLFAVERKKALPLVPQAVGVITSASGAAWQDVQKVSRSRFPGIPLYLYPVLVQGENAAQSIAQAIAFANTQKKVDVLLIGRGGGAREDLAAFDTELVVRAIADSEIPVVSAVGHESDDTLADLAADCRAATPSVAAALIFPDRLELQQKIDSLQSRLLGQMQNKLDQANHYLQMAVLRGKFDQPQILLANSKQRLQEGKENLLQMEAAYLQKSQAQLALMAAKLGSLDPLTVLSRGYAYVHKKNEAKPLISPQEVEYDELIDVVLANGELQCRVTGKGGK